MKQKIIDVLKKNKIFSSPILPIKFIYLKFKKREQFYFDNLFENVLSGCLIVKLENIPGQYKFDARSHILKKILLTKNYEPEIVNFITTKIDINKDAINVGANIGLYTNLLAFKLNKNNKVLAIEPTPNAFKFLTENIKLNRNSSKVIVYNGIATDLPGEYNINVIIGNEEYSSISNIVHSSVLNKEYISHNTSGETIDNLVEKYNLNPGIIVIDVEGAENKVLLGAVKTLKRFHPIIISELDDNLLSLQKTSSYEILMMLENLNYRISDSENKKLKFPFMGNIFAY